MRCRSIPGSIVLAAGAVLSTGAAPFEAFEPLEQALELLDPAVSRDPDDPCEGGETRVYKLAPTEELERLMKLLLKDPFMMPVDERGISIVLVARPLPCGETLLSARVELYDSVALVRRGGATRFLYRLTEWFHRRDPTMWDVLFPDDGVANKARRGYRLTNVLKFRRGDPFLGTVNGFGVVVFPIASNSVSGATLTFKTEKPARKRGKKRKRVVEGHFVALPGPDAPSDDPGKVRSKLGFRR